LRAAKLDKRLWICLHPLARQQLKDMAADISERIQLNTYKTEYSRSAYLKDLSIFESTKKDSRRIEGKNIKISETIFSDAKSMRGIEKQLHSQHNHEKSAQSFRQKVFR